MQYDSLFQPLKFNGIILRNRIMSAPMDVVKADSIISSTYYGGVSIYDKALGGAAVVYLSCDNDSPVDGVLSKYGRESTREKISVLKQAGAKAGAEVMFYSRPLSNGYFAGPVSGLRYDGAKMQEMTERDMQAFIGRIASHCKELKDFGFDTILLAFGHDSLLSQFLSPIFNTRKDEFGGSLANRIRFPKEALKQIRAAVGPNYPINVRLSRELMVPESYKPEEMIYFIKEVEEYIDMVNISTGMDGYGGTYNKYIANIHSVTTAFFPHMYSLDFAAEVKQKCNVLVSIVGAVMDPKEANDAIAEGKIDCVMMGRQLTADPFWVKKVQNDKMGEIVPCIRCGNCFHFTTEHKNVVCSVNPRFRRENRVPLKLEKAEVIKNVIVVGGGPAGCKAAVVAAERGHKVTIIEKTNRLGGKINSADYDSFKIDLKRYRDYIVNKVKSMNINIIFNMEATKEIIQEMRPDSLIIAVGSYAVFPSIDGIKNKNVIGCLDVFKNNIRPIGKVAIIGGGSVGCELALEMSKTAESVSIIERDNELALNSNITYRLSMEYFLPKHPNIKVYTNSNCILINEKGVNIQHKYDGETFIEADTIVVASGFKPDREKVEELFGIVADTYEVGDCEKVATLCEANNYAYFIASNL